LQLGCVIGYFISREQSIGDLFRKYLARVAGKKAPGKRLALICHLIEVDHEDGDVRSVRG
jgi:hypothetical protein